MEFVLLAAALGVALLVNAAAQRVERERRRVSEARPSGAGHALSHYELAYLSGGPRRAINTALAVLATAGAVRVSRGSQVTPVYGAPPSPVPIEQAVLDTLAPRPGGHRASELRRALAAHPALAELAAGLERRGLIVPEQAFARAWRRRDHLQIVMTGAAGFAVGALVLSAVIDMSGPAFVALLFFLGIALYTGAAGLARQRRSLRNVVTREGREVLRAARGHHPRGYRDQSSLALAVGVPVALYGLADAGDQLLCDELAAGDPSGDCAGSCGSHGGGDGATFGSDSYGGADFGGGSSSCGSGSSSSCGSSSGGGSSCGGGGGG
ncbi:TIGR04222 domain-containing membrane protein [Nonomuraea turkmeniaca]|uniref:TIGR04222 domain-containing membrane protein n=1 Tax=Nonomuraea turkmeniaca TaxID=103838 RepID=A0A5S4EXR3_9ACTN|nr:TIGR04222 domain-containing membrane protein [Nonomuraea turkmeniaca]TMR08466.1 TIGR04222 domain-containing membrane protein [Nonomuraea turkmeniaca]